MKDLITLEAHEESIGGDGDTPASRHCYAAIIEHWAKARIEGPMQVVSRYDESAKLLITLGGLFPAILVAAYSSLKQPAQTTSEVSLLQPSTVLFGAFLLFFLAFVGCLVMSCRWQLRMKLRGPQQRTEACEVSALLTQATLGSLTPENISSAVQHWSTALDELIKYKHKWVQLACICLTLSSSSMMVLLFVTSMGIRLTWPFAQ